MKSTVQALDENKVKVSVEVDEHEFDQAIEEAFRRLAREVRIPGFRPGKAPRRVLEARIGKGIGREEALRTSLPEYYSRAVIEHDVDVIAPPEIDITSGRESGAVQFDAVVEVRPRIQVEGYRDLQVEIPSPEVTDEDVAERIDQIRRQHSELAEVDRPAVDGDHVTIDIVGTHDGEELPGLTVSDYLYEVGAGAVVPEIDENLRGASAGQHLEFTAPHPDPDEEGELQFSITVQKVQERVLPELTDEFVADATEFSTVEELQADVRRRLAAVKKLQATLARREKVVEAVVDLVSDDDVPAAMVDHGLQERIQDFLLRLQQQGATVEQYFEATGQTAEELTDALRSQALQSAKLDLVLRAIAEAEGLTATEEELDEQVAQVAEQAGITPEVARERLAAVGQLSDLRADIGKRKALEWLIDNAALVDAEGNSVDPAALELESEEARELGGEEPEEDMTEALAAAVAAPPAEQQDEDEAATPDGTQED